MIRPSRGLFAALLPLTLLVAPVAAQTPTASNSRGRRRGLAGSMVLAACRSHPRLDDLADLGDDLGAQARVGLADGRAGGLADLGSEGFELFLHVGLFLAGEELGVGAHLLEFLAGRDDLRVAEGLHRGDAELSHVLGADAFDVGQQDGEVRLGGAP